MHFIIFLIILFLIWLIFGERIKRWLAGFMARRTEDYLRKATGMPPRPAANRKPARTLRPTAHQAVPQPITAQAAVPTDHLAEGDIAIPIPTNHLFPRNMPWMWNSRRQSIIPKPPLELTETGAEIPSTTKAK